MNIDTEKATIYGEHGSTFYSIMDGMIDIYDPDVLTEQELSDAVKDLEKMCEAE